MDAFTDSTSFGIRRTAPVAHVGDYHVLFSLSIDAQTPKWPVALFSPFNVLLVLIPTKFNILTIFFKKKLIGLKDTAIHSEDVNPISRQKNLNFCKINSAENEQRTQNGGTTRRNSPGRSIKCKIKDCKRRTARKKRGWPTSNRTQQTTDEIFYLKKKEKKTNSKKNKLVSSATEGRKRETSQRCNLLFGQVGSVS